VTEVSFDEFWSTIGKLGGMVVVDEVARREIENAGKALQELPIVNRASVAEVIREHPLWVPILGLAVGLSQEQLKNTLKYGLGSSAWRKLAKERAAEVVDLLDSEFGLLERIEEERGRQWSFADILIERFRSRSRAGGAIVRGRAVEDAVESIVRELGLPHDMRTRFTGRSGQSGPCDLAIPAGAERALIVCGIKGFDSTGSKLTDAAAEISNMAEIRRPTQYVFVVVDGIGWLSRKGDLRRIHALWQSNAIDGLYTLATLSSFRDHLTDAARNKRLL